MPETSSPYINGFQQNGHMEPEILEDTFLFTSESVGEGHPGEYVILKYFSLQTVRQNGMLGDAQPCAQHGSVEE